MTEILSLLVKTYIYEHDPGFGKAGDIVAVYSREQVLLVNMKYVMLSEGLKSIDFSLAMPY